MTQGSTRLRIRKRRGIVIGFAQYLDYGLSPAESGRDDYYGLSPAELGTDDNYGEGLSPAESGRDDYYGLSPAESGMDDDYAYPRQCRRRMKG